jgi:pantetheine-phosphate adenylyltransferase
MKIGLFCGSFDPPTLGHIDIIQRALKICDKLIIGIAVNSSKKNQVIFTNVEKKELLESVIKDSSSIEIVLIDGLVTDFARKRSVSFLVRGIRAFDDYEQEFRMALTNRKLSSIETIFLLSDERLSHISSTLIKEMAKNQKRLFDFVPKEIEETVFIKISRC